MDEKAEREQKERDVLGEQIPLRGRSGSIGNMIKALTTASTDLRNQQACLNQIIKLGDIKNYTGQLLENEGGGALLRYLKQEQPYKVVTEQATWGGLSAPGTAMAGRLGHHAMINIPGERVVEWSARGTGRSVPSEHISQSENRSATGRTIENMWETHLRISAEEGYMRIVSYRPWTNDCFTYVDKVLGGNSQVKTTLKRVTENEEELRALTENFGKKGSMARLTTLFSPIFSNKTSEEVKSKKEPEDAIRPK